MACDAATRSERAHGRNEAGPTMLTLVRSDQSGYSWDQKARRFRGPDGRFIGMNTIKAIKNRIIDHERGIAFRLVTRAIDGIIGVDRFVRDMRALTKRTTIQNYMLGRGGRHAMTATDRSRLGGLLKAQYRFLNRFAADLNNESVSKAQAKQRAMMYVESSRGAYDRGLAAAWNISLPAYPGQGTACLTRCKCSWSISEHGSGKTREIRAYWRTNSAEPCETCESRRSEYNPYVTPQPEPEE